MPAVKVHAETTLSRGETKSSMQGDAITTATSRGKVYSRDSLIFRSKWDALFTKRGYQPAYFTLQFKSKKQESAYREWYQATYRDDTNVRFKIKAICMAILFAYQCCVVAFIIHFVSSFQSSESTGQVMMAVASSFNFFALSARFVGMTSNLWNLMVSPLFTIFTITTGIGLSKDIRECMGLSEESSEDDERSCEDALHSVILGVCMVGLMSSIVQLVSLKMMLHELVRSFCFTIFSVLAFVLLVLVEEDFDDFLESFDHASIPIVLLVSWTSLFASKWLEEFQSRRHFVLIESKRFATMLQNATQSTIILNEEPSLLQNLVPKGVVHIKDSDVEIMNVIGQGTFGYVYRARFKGEIVAVKTFDLHGQKDKQDVQEHFRQELEILSIVRHPNILCIYGASCKSSEQGSIVTEFASHGTLQDIFSFSEYGWEIRERLLLGLAKGMCFLHHFLPHVVVHHDLKPPNIFVGENWTAKVADFGVSLVIPRNENYVNCGQTLAGEPTQLLGDLIKGQTGKIRGSPIWLAPEVHKDESYDEKIDVYAFSLILCEALIGDGMYVLKCFKSAGSNLADLAKRGFRPAIPESIRVAKPGIVSLLESCWAERPRDRPSFEQITAILADLSAAGSASSPTNSSTSMKVDRKSPTCFNLMSVREETERLSSSLVNSDDDEITQTQPTNPMLGSKKGSGLHIHVRALSSQTLNSEGDSESYGSIDDYARENGGNLSAKLNSISDSLLQASVRSSQSVTSDSTKSGVVTPSGRAFSTFGVTSSSNDPAVLRQLCQELQDELAKQTENYELTLAQQKEYYEKKLAQLASAVL